MFFKIDEERKESIEAPNNMLAPSITLFNELTNSEVPQTTPPIESEEPLINFVKLCITISAPNCAGEIDKGENVLSTINFKLYFFAKTDNAIISATSNNGLLTDSQ